MTAGAHAGPVGRTDPCIAVLGTGRSGTSATAGLLVKLGLTGPPPDDLIEASSSNELGHWESKTVHWCNAQLLRAVGCTTFAPPPVTRRWSAVPNYADVRARALQWFEKTHTDAPVMVKDPRLCLTLPFWRDVIPAPMASILVIRDPVKVARSLQARDDIPVSLGLALCDRYLRSASVGMEGMPALVLEYDSLLQDPVESTERICEFLERSGVVVGQPARERAAGHLDARLRHHVAKPDEYDGMAQVQRDVFEILVSQGGTHDAWSSPEMPPPPDWVEDVLRLRRAFAARNRELNWLKSQSGYRVEAAIRRLLGRPAEFSDLLDVTPAGRPLPSE